jgi:pyrrolidone-carboxylate peptidase
MMGLVTIITETRPTTTGMIGSAGGRGKLIIDQMNQEKNKKE